MTCDYIQPSLSAYFNLTLFLVIDTLIGWHIFAFTLKKEFLYNFNHLANSLLESNSAQFSIDGNLLLLSMLSVSINDPFNQFNPLTQLLPCKISNTVQKVSDFHRCSTKYIRFLSMIYCCQQKSNCVLSTTCCVDDKHLLKCSRTVFANIFPWRKKIITKSSITNRNVTNSKLLTYVVHSRALYWVYKNEVTQKESSLPNTLCKRYTCNFSYILQNDVNKILKLDNILFILNEYNLFIAFSHVASQNVHCLHSFWRRFSNTYAKLFRSIVDTWVENRLSSVLLHVFLWHSVLGQKNFTHTCTSIHTRMICHQVLIMNIKLKWK